MKQLLFILFIFSVKLFCCPEAGNPSVLVTTVLSMQHVARHGTDAPAACAMTTLNSEKRETGIPVGQELCGFTMG